MNLSFKNKHVLVTGASKGLGRAIALAFAKLDAKLSVVARSEKELQTLVEEMGGKEKGHMFIATDLTMQGSIEKTIRSFEDSQGDFDIVIHNIGGAMAVREPLSPWKEWEKALYFNAGIAIEINNMIIPKMQEKKYGRIVHISSISGKNLRGNPLYASAKAFLNDYVTTLGRKLAPEGVVVSAVLPGAFKFPGSYWDSLEKEGSPVVSDFLRHHQAISRFGEVEDIVPFVIFMSSEYARFAPGATIAVDGGSM